MSDTVRFIITAVSGAVIGYSTNWIAIKMLFRPTKEKKIFGIKVPFTPGLIPKERYKLAIKVAETIDTHLLNDDAVVEALSSEEMLKAIENMLNVLLNKLALEDGCIRDKIDIDNIKDITKQYSHEIYEACFENLLNIVVDVYGSLKISDKTLADYIKDDKKDLLKEHMLKYAPSMRDYIYKTLTDNPEIEDKIKNIALKLIQDNLGSFMGIFVNPEKIYNNMKNSAIEYLNDEAHFNEVFDFLWFGVEMVLNKPVCEFTDLTSQDNINTFFKDFEQNYNIIDNLLLKLIDKVGSIKINSIVTTILVPKKDLLIDHILKLIQKLVISNSTEISGAFNVQSIIKNKINTLEVMDAEKIILGVVKKELNMITMLGGLLGFLIATIVFFLSM